MMLAAFEVPIATVAVGAVVGLAYAAFATGLVLVHRAQRVVNLAHVQMGSVGAAVLAYLVNQLGFPWPIACLVGVAASAGIAALIEMTVMRRLADSPRLTVLVATVGLAQLLVLVTYLITDHTPDRRDGFPSPLDAARTVGGGDLTLSTGQQLVLLLVPPALLGVAALLRFTDLGVVVRAASENRDAANLAGVSVGLVTTGVWALAGGLSGITASALAPDRGLVLSEAFSPDLLVRALAAAVIARMSSIGIACLAGIGIGILEQLVFWNWPASPGAVELALLVLVLLAFLLQPAGPTGRAGADRSSWTAATGARPLPAELRRHPRVRRAGVAAAVAAVALAAAVPLLLSNARTLTLVVVGCFVLLALSITVLTGAAGQVSLGQVAFLGVGAAVAYQMSRAHELPFLVGIVVAAVVGAALTVAIGVPALRRPGLFLAVTTLSFALVTPRWLLPQTWMLGSGVTMERPALLGIDLSSQHAYYLVVLAVLVVSLVATRSLLGGPIGRSMVAVRDNDRQAAALGIGPTRTKVLAFALAGAMASATGTLYGAAISNFGPENFAVADSLRMLSVAVIGGLGSVAGTVTAAFAVFGVDRLVTIPQLKLLTTSLGLLAVVLFLPGGLVQPLMAVRDALARRIAGVAPEPSPRGEAADVEEALAQVEAAPPVDLAGVVADLPAGGDAEGAGRSVGEPCLRAEGITVRFGGIVAVDDVTLEVAQGEVVGLLGPNGAGKTTLLEAISGHVRPAEGSVLLAGEPLDRLAPQARVGRGLVRSFQDARLFPSLTVRQVLLLAQQLRLPTSTVAALLTTPGARRRERERAAHVDAVLAAVRLDRYAEATVGELSTGTRRICELAAALSLGPRLLLLDEPTAGLAQREVEELPRVLADVVARTGVALVVVEHDVPFLSAVADRLVALQAGRVIADGPPAEVCADPEVVRAYLGGDATAIARSGTVVA
jgi:ABC-type branched-subunit amino acid transport system ATPase component/ABC-type branched-subunit amino acid transport system permease subunit